MDCKAEKLAGELSYENMSRLNDNGMSSVHYHNAYEIYYLQDGNRGYDIKDKTFRVNKGNLILIDKFKKHKTFNYDNNSFNRMLVKFKDTSVGNFNQEDYDLLSSFNKGINIIQFDARDRIMIENIFARMEAEKRKNKPGQKLYLKTLLIELLIYINRYVDDKDTNPKERNYHVKIVEIMNYIDENYNKELTLSKLADRFSYSSSYLSSLFKKKSNYTITEYINNTRIKEAQNLLLNGKQNITQVSENVGYNNLVHFGRNFKRITGLTPSEYRKCYKNN